MEQIILELICCMLILIIVFLVFSSNKKDKLFAEERKDYLNRLMSKNTQEYIQVSKQETKKPVITDGDILGDDRYDGILN